MWAAYERHGERVLLDRLSPAGHTIGIIILLFNVESGRLIQSITRVALGRLRPHVMMQQLLRTLPIKRRQMGIRMVHSRRVPGRLCLRRQLRLLTLPQQILVLTALFRMDLLLWLAAGMRMMVRHDHHAVVHRRQQVRAALVHCVQGTRRAVQTVQERRVRLVHHCRHRLNIVEGA